MGRYQDRSFPTTAISATGQAVPNAADVLSIAWAHAGSTVGDVTLRDSSTGAIRWRVKLPTTAVSDAATPSRPVPFMNDVFVSLTGGPVAIIQHGKIG